MAPTPSSRRPGAPQTLRARKPKTKTRGRLVVPLSSRPRDYVPGSGPPLQRIRLAPPQDSTAYIVERIFLPSPGPAANGKPLPKRMTYIVGWRDLPAARLLVPAMQILDYVSPRALEDWEWAMELELERDRKKLAEEMEADDGQAAAKKARPPAHTEIETAAVAEAETDAHARHKMGAMSLSTPQKARLEDFEGLTDDEFDSPSRQIARETTAWDLTEDDSGPGLKVVSDSDGPRVHLADTRPPLSTEPSSYRRGTAWGPPTAASDLETAATPLPQPLLPRGRAAAASASSSRVLTPRAAPDPPPHGHGNGGFTPFNGSRRQYATPDPARWRSAAAAGSPTPKKQPASSAKKSGGGGKAKAKAKAAPAAATPAPVIDQGGERAWVVKRLEDVQEYEAEGQGPVRYFQVRWEGDWPPDENPTWEPEANLPPNLVRNFFKQGKRRRRRGAAARPAKRRRATTLGIDVPYKSVSEAFAGEVADADADDGAAAAADLDSDDAPPAPPANAHDDDFFVIEEAPQPLRPARPSWGGRIPRLSFF